MSFQAYLMDLSISIKALPKSSPKIFVAFCILKAFSLLLT
nr:MAG TPA: hypothetical protein [Bacteriophage sp.]